MDPSNYHITQFRTIETLSKLNKIMNILFGKHEGDMKLCQLKYAANNLKEYFEYSYKLNVQSTYKHNIDISGIPFENPREYLINKFYENIYLTVEFVCAVDELYNSIK
jgi:hypothetical protein